MYTLCVSSSRARGLDSQSMPHEGQSFQVRTSRPPSPKPETQKQVLLSLGFPMGSQWLILVLHWACKDSRFRHLVIYSGSQQLSPGCGASNIGEGQGCKEVWKKWETQRVSFRIPPSIAHTTLTGIFAGKFTIKRKSALSEKRDWAEGIWN